MAVGGSRGAGVGMCDSVGLSLCMLYDDDDDDEDGKVTGRTMVTNARFSLRCVCVCVCVCVHGMFVCVFVLCASVKADLVDAAPNTRTQKYKKQNSGNENIQTLVIITRHNTGNYKIIECTYMQQIIGTEFYYLKILQHLINEFHI